MPCNDLNEYLRVTVSEDGHLEEYRYVKAHCGRGVGDASFLLDALRGLSVEEVLALSPESPTFINPADSREAFLYKKHLAGLQAALRVLTGREACGPDSACAAARIECEETRTVLTARISMNTPAAPIPPCHSTCRSAAPAIPARRG